MADAKGQPIPHPALALERDAQKEIRALGRHVPAAQTREVTSGFDGRAGLILYHWAPTARRKAILRSGLKPGSLSRNRAWRPPFICYSVNPRWAIDSADAYHPISEAMDLWQVDTQCGAVGFLETFDHGQDEPHLEVRIYERVPAHYCHWVATREPQSSQIVSSGA